MLLVTICKRFRSKTPIDYEMNSNIPGPCQAKLTEGIQILWRKLKQAVMMLECGFSVMKSFLILHRNNTQSKHPLSTRLSSGVRGKVIFHYPSAKIAMVGKFHPEWYVIIFWAFQHIKYSFLTWDRYLGYIRDNIIAMRFKLTIRLWLKGQIGSIFYGGEPYSKWSLTFKQLFFMSDYP